jgi:hypothetical protein
VTNPVTNLVQLRRATEAEWAGANPVLAEGEEGHELGTGRRKVGDGQLPWADLPYWPPPAGGQSAEGLLALVPDVLTALGTATPPVTVGSWAASSTRAGTLFSPFALPTGIVRGGLVRPHSGTAPAGTALAGTSAPGLQVALNTVNDPDANAGGVVVEFDWSTSATNTLHLVVWAKDGGPVRAQVWANGQQRGDVASASLAAGTFQVLPLTLSAALPVRVRIRLQNCQFAGLSYPPATTAIGPVNDRRLRLAVLGDSWTGGALGIEELDLWPHVLAQMLGADLGRMGQGGTGYATDNPGAGVVRYTHPTRLARLAEFAPQLVIVQGSQNDDLAGKTAAEIGDGAAAVYAHLARTCPDAAVVVVGPPRLNAAPSPSRLANNDAVRAAAAAAPNVTGYIDQIGVTAAQAAAARLIAPSTSYAAGEIARDASGSFYRAAAAHTTGAATDYQLLRAGFTPLTWITGTGRFQALANDGGTADLVLHNDAAHLTAWGHLWFARRVLTDTVRLLSGNPS